MNSEPDPAKLGIAEFSRQQVEMILEKGTTEDIPGKGRPIVLLTMRGARSGQLRYKPVMRVEHQGSYAVVGSNGASTGHPAWYYNLKAHPEVSLQDGTAARKFLAHEADGAERAEWWQRAMAAYPDYGAMQARTERTLPLFVLDPL